MNKSNEETLWWVYQRAQEALRLGKFSLYQQALRQIADKLGSQFVNRKVDKLE